ncbi:hypothetical protein CLCR_02197 [Cladophialophora carrionii]|uniref:Uncharacterized protein n=1 Tax=Cladophialophora carrionii TaxID=86049 RepID=A0A1C1CDR6_9EURO|nr:hypothetical protein CLCR_02197 [Cladophialophora carrionii]
MEAKLPEIRPLKLSPPVDWRLLEASIRDAGPRKRGDDKVKPGLAWAGRLSNLCGLYWVWSPSSAQPWALPWNV